MGEGTWDFLRFVVSSALGGGGVGLVIYMMTFRVSERNEYLKRLEDIYLTLNTISAVMSEISTTLKSLRVEFIELSTSSNLKERELRELLEKFQLFRHDVDEKEELNSDKLNRCEMLLDLYFPSLDKLRKSLEDAQNKIEKSKNKSPDSPDKANNIKKDLATMEDYTNQVLTNIEEAMLLVTKHGRKLASQKPWSWSRI